MAVSGCFRPMTMTTLRGGLAVYPDVVVGKPTILAFLNANDRRCDEVIPSLWGLSNRPGSPARIIGVMVYDDLSYVSEIDTLDYASELTVLMDPDRRLTRRFGVTRFPLFIFLSADGKVIDRARRLTDVPRWIDEDRWYRRALPEPDEEVPAI